jgi:hypothetical protein
MRQPLNHTTHHTTGRTMYNVTLAGQLQTTTRDFARTTAERILHYATMRTPFAGKGVTWGRRHRAFASLHYCFAEVRVEADAIILEFGRRDEDPTTVTLSVYESPASIAANHSWRLGQLVAATLAEDEAAQHASNCPTHIDHALRCRCTDG